MYYISITLSLQFLISVFAVIHVSSFHVSMPYQPLLVEITKYFNSLKDLAIQVLQAKPSLIIKCCANINVEFTLCNYYYIIISCEYILNRETYLVLFHSRVVKENLTPLQSCAFDNSRINQFETN